MSRDQDVLVTTTRRRNPRGQGDRLRDELVEAASRLLETSFGEDSLSLRAIARETGVATTSVYRHFPDRAAVMLAVLQRRFEEFGAVLADAETGSSTPRDALRARCEAYLDYAAAHPGPYRVMFSAVPASAPPDQTGLLGPALIDELRERIGRCRGADADPAADRRRAFLLWSALHGLATLATNRPAADWPARAALLDELLDRILG